MHKEGGSALYIYGKWFKASEGGITCTADVIMTVDKINQPDPFTVTFDANGGQLDNGIICKRG